MSTHHHSQEKLNFGLNPLLPWHNTLIYRKELMKLKRLGKNTSKVEIHISPFGIWLLAHDVEYFLAYKNYPWFQQAKVSEIYDVKLLSETHLYWPSLDVDLDLDILENPEKYPLVYHK